MGDHEDTLELGGMTLKSTPGGVEIYVLGYSKMALCKLEKADLPDIVKFLRNTIG